MGSDIGAISQTQEYSTLVLYLVLVFNYQEGKTHRDSRNQQRKSLGALAQAKLTGPLSFDNWHLDL